ncbi:MAG TPA: acylphosphatase [Pseudolabrys sp.]|jgi:acylphosphatase|nr:acylphosphatase [Pseudolabrys sp.]
MAVVCYAGTMDAQTMRHVSIRGRVQGVGYRAFVEREALAAGLEGWVRNRPDGSVEALFSGPAAVVDKMIASCRRGPYAARVDALDERPADQGEMRPRRTGERFSVLPTA